MCAKQDQNGRYAKRTAIFKALLNAVRYALQSDGDLVEDQTGLDITKGTTISTEELIKRGMSQKSIRSLNNEGLLNRGNLIMFLDPSKYRSDY
jgi:hypothetical protein